MKLLNIRFILFLFLAFIIGVVLTNIQTIQTIRSKAALNSLTLSGLKAAYPSKRGDSKYNQAYDINLDGVIADLDFIQLRTKIAARSPQDAGMLNWVKRPFVGSGSVFSTANGSNLQEIPDDIVVTGVMMQISGISKGEIFDICPMNITRSTSPKYDAGTGGFSEILCYYVSRLHSAENIDLYIDLNDTPLFFSKGSTVLCSVTAYGVPEGKGSNLKKNCHL